jgi:hypothetical protein
LTGLEVAETKAEVKPEHWIERGPSKRLMLFSGRSHPALAERIGEKLGLCSRRPGARPPEPAGSPDDAASAS